jgi:diguanylate cyclase (GGDEF)-like protein/putative nucleotidyltransferase with HDIG domain
MAALARTGGPAMKDFRQLQPAARLYVVAVVLLGTATVAHSVHQLYVHPLGSQWFIIAALTLLTGSFTVKVPSTNASLSVSETFVFASVLLFGAAAGAITVLLECLTILFWMKPGGRSVQRVLFNLAAPAIAIWVSGTTFYWISGIQPYSQHATPLNRLFLPLGAFTALYFLLNSWLVAFALGFETDKSPVDIWWTNFTWLSVNYFSGASVAALIVAYTRELDFSTLAIIVPLLIVSYLTFRTAMGRVEDSNQHLSELNRLHLSTIETLAMAIDAKDQITHGHIRRVQAYAVGLAKHVGIVEHTLIKAIEAAALLHDMGKLAVPEYILNKPGKLTPAEFEKMKLHASVGADILSAIDFPYPVVPIVRHHHENWDGTGYPDGIKGTSIPIGARILSVVDCFDALTSDRPYRPRLSNEQALSILADRRGSMYDPLIVDTFVRVHEQIAPEARPVGPPQHALQEITSSTQGSTTNVTSSRFEDIAAGADEMLTLYELARALGGQVNISDTGDIIAKHLRRLIPSALCVFYIYNIACDELEAKHSVGDSASIVMGLRIPLGQRLSGWVAANRQTIVNSDPILDLGDSARSATPRLRSCLSTPLVSDDQLVGVLTLYSASTDAFTEDHRRIIEVVATQLAQTIKRTDFDKEIRPDPLTGLPNISQLQQLIESGPQQLAPASALTLLFIDVTNLHQINASHGSNVADEVLNYVVKHTRSNLRAADILFRHGSHEFIAVLNAMDSETAILIASRIRQNVCDHTVATRGNVGLTIDTTITCVSAPQDGTSLSALTSAARARGVAEPKGQPGGSIH